MIYESTRQSNHKVAASEAIVKGIAEDGGLYCSLDYNNVKLDWELIKTGNYQDVAYEVMKHYLSDFTEIELKNCISNAYDSGFEKSSPVEIKQIGNSFFLELYHGQTAAFKDMALSILPHLMIESLKKQRSIGTPIILTATSGDTGSAALYGFKGVLGIDIAVFYPNGGVSDIQKRQMVGVNESNTYVCGIEGNFDDAQSKVKELFEDEKFNQWMKEHNKFLSSANSINIGRLIPQMVYYIYTYAQLVKNKNINWGDEINFSVPTGNFGNILAAYYAKKAGLPIKKLICASNDNNVLYDFIKTGKYDKNREFKKTISPSMDILISSNLERLLYSLVDGDKKRVSKYMLDLKQNGCYELEPDILAKLDCFYGGYGDDQKTKKEIKRVFDEENYLIDPHTAVASAVYQEYKDKTKDDTTTVIVSTASPYKFTRSVYEAIFDKSDLNEFELINKLNEKTKGPIPKSLQSVTNTKPHHFDSCKQSEMGEYIQRFIKEKIEKKR